MSHGKAQLLVFVFEPDGAVAETMADVLEGHGHAAVVEQEPRRARRRLATELFDIALIESVLWDDEVPIPSTWPTPVIIPVLSSHPRFTPAPDSVLLIKPFGAMELINAIERALQKAPD